MNTVILDGTCYAIGDACYDSIRKIVANNFIAIDTGTPKPEPTPSPTVEISLEDANELKNLLFKHSCLFYANVVESAISKAESKWWGNDGGLSDKMTLDHAELNKRINKDLDDTIRLMNSDRFAIKSNKKSQVKADVKEDEWDRLNRLRGFSSKDLVNVPALPIQDQVNELRNNCSNYTEILNQHTNQINHLVDTISRLVSVIEGMKPNLNAVRG